MSERRSWDTGRGYTFATDPTITPEDELSHNRRTVVWRDDWPPQSEVPHAGEVVWWDHEGVVRREGVVVHGLPHDDGMGRWYVLVEYGGSGVGWWRIDQLSRTPPTKRYRVSLDHACCCAKWEDFVEAESEADAIAKAVRVEEVE